MVDPLKAHVKVTILIPSRNRYQEILLLLDSCVEHLGEENSSFFEVLISDNSDFPYQINLIDDYASINLRIVRPPSILLTAEENLFFAWGHSKGDYVWTLGDDDPINFSELDYLLELIENDQGGILFWNSNLITSGGKLVSKNRLPMRNELFEIEVNELIARAGAWYATSGFSTWVIQRNLIDPEEAIRWFKDHNSAIYGHVTFYMKSLGNLKVTVVNRPLVYYRMNLYDETGDQGNWKQYANKNKKYFREAWISDFPKQIKTLEDLGICDQGFISRVIEQDHNGYRYPLLFTLADLFLEQLEIAIHDPREIPPKLDFEYVLNLVSTHLPSSFSPKTALLDIFESISRNRFKNLFYYRLIMRRHQATINLLRYNLYVRKVNAPFQDFSGFNLDQISQYQYIDFGIGRKYHYQQPLREKISLIETNLLLLKTAQYMPFRSRRFLKKIWLRLMTNGA